MMSDFVSKCVLRVEISEAQGDEASQDRTSDDRPVRGICVETFPSRLESPRDDWGLLPAASRRPPDMMNPGSEEHAKDEIGFFSGNPFVEITKGVLHLYKEDTLSNRKEAMILCLLGVPASLTCHDLLSFTAPCHADISHIRVLRDSIPNEYMALLNFRSNESAIEFYTTFNGLPFNNLEPDIVCRIVWVSNVEWAHDGTPPVGHTELPVCPVCLERMDESVDGVLTILCNHTFHSSCLDKWTDTTCPVCRFVQSPEQAENSECEQCGKSGPSPDALWICLICGHVGCGRYQAGHAASHYRESGHCYALQLGSHRVWDYKGDNFVHRLIQNKADGKIVPTEGPPSEAECAEEKVDSVQLEFTYLLASQLDEQRLYYEEKLALLESQLLDEAKDLRTDMATLMDENRELLIKLSAAAKETQALERKLIVQGTKLSTSLHDLNEERQLCKALRNNQAEWQNKLKDLETKYTDMKKSNETQMAELKEQVRDLMFYIESNQTIQKSEHKDEIAEGTVTIGEAPQTSKGKRGKKHK